jgi:hypothetical protein
MGFNPSYSLAEVESPHGETGFEEYWEYWTAVFEERRLEAHARLYGQYQWLGEHALGNSFRLGSDAIIIDAIPYRSAKVGDAWSPSIWAYLREQYTLAALTECCPRVVVTAGAWALWCLRDLLPELRERLVGTLRVGKLAGTPIKARASWGEFAVLSVPHLTGAHGVTLEQRLSFAGALAGLLT